LRRKSYGTGEARTGDDTDSGAGTESKLPKGIRGSFTGIRGKHRTGRCPWMYGKRYGDFGPDFAAEKLEEMER
jgi:hypothetical protein